MGMDDSFCLTKVIRTIFWIFFKRVYDTFPEAAALLKKPIKRYQAQKSQTTLKLFTGGYQAYLALVQSNESGV
jgi:hypothetical protein